MATPTTLSPSATRTCLRIADRPDDALRMPAPTRLAKPLVLALGTDGPDTLAPPRPGQRSAVSVAQLRSFWRADPIRQPTARASWLLARFTARLPATQDADGRLVPLVDDRLSWVLLQRHVAIDLRSTAAPPALVTHGPPSTPPACTYDGVSVVAWDARTGRMIENEGFILGRGRPAAPAAGGAGAGTAA